MHLSDVAACPVCKSELPDLLRCGACGASFSVTDGTPNLIPSAARRKFEIDFDIAHSTVSPERFGSVLRYPPRHGESPDAPHRMDRAFIDVIESLPQGARILEVGCGGGQLRGWLAERGYEYLGTDISKTRIQEWLQSFGGPDVLCDAHFLPIADRQFDLVYSSAVNEHLACPLLAALETCRVLKPGGYFVGSVSFLEPWHDDSYYHMSPLGVWELLAQAGFESRYIWPGWHGYRAIMAMGSRHTAKLAFLAEALHAYFRAGNQLRNRLRHATGRTVQPGVLDASRIAGAMDWIARRPLS